MGHDIGNGIESVTVGVSAAIHRIAQHEEQVVEAGSTVLAQAPQAAQHLHKHGLTHAL